MATKQGIQNVIGVSFLALILLVVFIAGNPAVAILLSVYISMMTVSVLAYRTPQFRDNLLGIRGGQSLRTSIVLGVAYTAVFFLVIKLIPFASIGLPMLPQTIGETLRTIIVLVFAPVVETIFFQSVVYAVLLTTFRSKLVAFWGQAGIFSTAHVAAYVTGFYNYPSFAIGVSAVQANIGSFVAAFLFASVAMFFLLRKNINNLAFAIVFHAGLNLVILTSLTVIFA